MKILAIETSCDETSVAIVETTGSRIKPVFRVLSHLVSSQIAMHTRFGGVVPNLARREHERLLVPLFLKALREAGVIEISNIKYKISKLPGKNKNEIRDILHREGDLLAQFEKKIFSLPMPGIDVIAVTNGPGLAPALWVGVNFARALSHLWDIPLIPVNHMKGHLFSGLLQSGKEIDRYQISNVKFPLLGLLVSGGHTELVRMKKFGDYAIIGETLDDAVGEAFDKVARMLGLGYPGGPAIAAAAVRYQTAHTKKQDNALPVIKRFPRPMIGSKNFNFSFSGLKTSVLYFIRDLADKKSLRDLTPGIAKEFQDAAVDVLVAKTIRAIKEKDIRTLAVGGGVSANRLLSARLAQEVKIQCPQTELFIPHPSLTGDNALMIAVAAVMDGKKKTPNHVGVEANMRLSV